MQLILQTYESLRITTQKCSKYVTIVNYLLFVSNSKWFVSSTCQWLQPTNDFDFPTKVSSLGYIIVFVSNSSSLQSWNYNFGQ